MTHFHAHCFLTLRCGTAAADPACFPPNHPIALHAARPLNAEERQKIAEEMAQFCFEAGFPYFERFASKEVAYAVLSNEDQESRLHAPIPLGRAERAVALGFLTGGATEARRMIEAKRRYLSELNPQYTRMFEAFVACFEKQTSLVMDGGEGGPNVK